MINRLTDFILRLYLRRGAQATAARMEREVWTACSASDLARYKAAALADFFCRAARVVCGRTSRDMSQLIEEEKNRALHKYAK